jgi:hypothetical protein
MSSSNPHSQSELNSNVPALQQAIDDANSVKSTWCAKGKYIPQVEHAKVLNSLTAAVRITWGQYQVTEHHGLEFGHAVYELRRRFGSGGGNGSAGTGLVQVLDTLNIPRSTAYYWLGRYQISIGEKKPKPDPFSKPAPDAVTGPQDYTATDELRKWIRAHCPSLHVYVQGSGSGVVARSTAGGDAAFDVEIRKVSVEQAKAIFQNVREPSGVADLLDVDRKHFDALFAGKPPHAVQERVAALQRLLLETYAAVQQ